jgi:ribosomal small subunit protein bTHX
LRLPGICGRLRKGMLRFTMNGTEEHYMGRGDMKTKRGKVARGTRGNTRPKHGDRKRKLAAKKAAHTAAKTDA